MKNHCETQVCRWPLNSVVLLAAKARSTEIVGLPYQGTGVGCEANRRREINQPLTIPCSEFK